MATALAAPSPPIRTRLALPVSGMTCGSCVARVERALAAVPGVTSVSVNLATDTALVDYDPARLDGATLAAATVAAGYGLREATTPLVVGGMSCASCVGRVERALQQVPGVIEAAVDLAGERARVRHVAGVEATALLRAVREAGYRAALPEDRPSVDAEAEERRRRAWDQVILLGAVLLSAPLIAPMLGVPFGLRWHLPPLVELLLATPVQLIAGARFYRSAWQALRARSGNMELLVAIGTSAAYLYSLVMVVLHDAAASGHLYFEASAAIITLVLLGKWLEDRAKVSAREALTALMALRPERARVMRGGREAELPVEAVTVGDLVILRPGERVPVDATILKGTSELDESLLTGESLPVTRGPGDIVIAGAVNGPGLLRLRALRVGEDTTLARIRTMVEAAQTGKAPVQRLVDRISGVFVPLVIAIALATFVAWLLWADSFEQALVAAVAVLVIACPCALGLATPAALVTGTGVAARAGILVRDIDTLERAHALRIVAFDKTGTLTRGRPELTAIHSRGGDDDTVLALAATAERGSEHPLGRAIVAAAEARGLALDTPDAVRALPGRGLEATVAGRHLLLGTQRLMEDEGITEPTFATRAAALEAEGHTVAWLARDGRALGLLALADRPHPHAAAAVAALARVGIASVMISGDNRATTERIAAMLRIGEVMAPVQPAEKAAAVAALRRRGGAVAMVGDGVNDAPALAAADVGIAMGTGAEVALATAGLTLMRPDPLLVADAIAIARATRRKIRQNLFWAFIYNTLGIPLAALGLLTPAVAGAAMALSSVSVVTNALLLKRWRAAAGGVQ
jgi:Cu+-exporting ATPase